MINLFNKAVAKLNATFIAGSQPSNFRVDLSSNVPETWYRMLAAGAAYSEQQHAYINS
jgi:hypothetical protein